MENKVVKNTIWIGIMLSVFCCTVAWAEEPWRFMVVADWHGAENYVWKEQSPESYRRRLEQHTAEIIKIKGILGGELVVSPGDSNGGHWCGPDFIKRFSPGATPEEAILKAGDLCYSSMMQAFSDGGYPRLLMAVGDHELGDNPWPAGSVVARCQPQFREIFAKVWCKRRLKSAAGGGAV